MLKSHILDCGIIYFGVPGTFSVSHFVLAHSALALIPSMFLAVFYLIHTRSLFSKLTLAL